MLEFISPTRRSFILLGWHLPFSSMTIKLIGRLNAPLLKTGKLETNQHPYLASVPVIIPLNGTEQSSPGQVSASLNTPLLPSSITIGLSQEPASANMSQIQSSIGENPRALAISGSISPTYAMENVSIYVNNGSTYNYFTTATNDSGGYMLTWNFTSSGTYYIRTSWSGASNYAGADSKTLTVFAGPESTVQFVICSTTYMGESAFAEYAAQPLQGVNDFLSIPLGIPVSFSYDFSVLPAGQTGSNVQTETVTVPASQYQILLGIGRNSEINTMQVPAETMIIPVNVPQGLVPIMLPDDFNQTINNQFCFILQDSSGNYSLNVNSLDAYEMFNMTQSNGNAKSFMNASENIRENSWYNVTASISDNVMTANLYNTNGTLIESKVTPYNATNSNEMVMLIANNVDSAVILKDLTIQPLNSSTQLSQSIEKPSNGSELLLLYISLSILLVATFSVAVIYLKKKRQMRDKNT